jgi:hypothetical protein
MGVVTHRTVEELDDTTQALQLLQQKDLVYILASQAIRRGDEDTLHLRRRNRIAQRVQARTA